MRFPLTLRVQQHLSLFWSYYAAVCVICILLALFLGWNSFREQRFTEIVAWPEATATIQCATINQFNTTTKTGSSWSVNVDMDLSFTANDVPIRARFVDSFHRAAGSDYAATLAEGKIIRIRYNPRDPNVVSLYPYLY